MTAFHTEPPYIYIILQWYPRTELFHGTTKSYPALSHILKHLTNIIITHPWMCTISHATLNIASSEVMLSPSVGLYSYFTCLCIKNNSGIFWKERKWDSIFFELISGVRVRIQRDAKVKQNQQSSTTGIKAQVASVAFTSKIIMYWNQNVEYTYAESRKIETLDMVRAGLHCSFKMSRQMLPLLLIFGWKTLVLNATCSK